MEITFLSVGMELAFFDGGHGKCFFSRVGMEIIFFKGGHGRGGGWSDWSGASAAT